MANFEKWSWTVGRDGEEVPNHENEQYIHPSTWKEVEQRL